MSSISLKLKEKFYKDQEHPYRIYEKTITEYLKKSDVVVDAGCGRKAPVLQKLIGQSSLLVGLDISGLEKVNGNKPLYLINSDLNSISLRDNSVDVVISRSVLEHLKDPTTVYKELYRILKTGGYFIFLTPNLLDYTSIVAKIIPNRFHSYIVKKTEGRSEHDTFPTHYRSNTQWDIQRLSNLSNFKIENISFLGQYPSYFLFNPLLFLLGVAYDKLICKFELLHFFRGWILCVLKKNDTS